MLAYKLRNVRSLFVAFYILFFGIALFYAPLMAHQTEVIRERAKIIEGYE